MLRAIVDQARQGDEEAFADVDGLRFVVQTTDYAGTSKKHRTELRAIVDSVTLEP